MEFKPDSRGGYHVTADSPAESRRLERGISAALSFEGDMKELRRVVLDELNEERQRRMDMKNHILKALEACDELEREVKHRWDDLAARFNKHEERIRRIEAVLAAAELRAQAPRSEAEEAVVALMLKLKEEAALREAGPPSSP